MGSTKNPNHRGMPSGGAQPPGEPPKKRDLRTNNGDANAKRSRACKEHAESDVTITDKDF